MFWRTKPTPDEATEADESAQQSGKGRPTPSRKEAEAARKARVRPPRTRKELAKRQREHRAESSAKMRQAMKTGDERYLPARDRGPKKRFIRDFVDTRFSLVELMIPLLVVTMILGYSGSPRLAGFGNALFFATIVMVIVDVFILRWRLRRELTHRFPDESMSGTTYYACVRAMQIRWLRLPKPQVKIGTQLPERYR